MWWLQLCAVQNCVFNVSAAALVIDATALSGLGSDVVITVIENLFLFAYLYVTGTATGPFTLRMAQCRVDNGYVSFPKV